MVVARVGRLVTESGRSGGLFLMAARDDWAAFGPRTSGNYETLPVHKSPGHNPLRPPTRATKLAKLSLARRKSGVQIPSPPPHRTLWSVAPSGTSRRGRAVPGQFAGQQPRRCVAVLGRISGRA